MIIKNFFKILFLLFALFQRHQNIQEEIAPISPVPIVEEVSKNFLMALKPDTTPKLSAFLMQMLAGQEIFDKPEILLRELHKNIHFQNTFDLLKRVNSENYQINLSLAVYIMQFRVLQKMECSEFKSAQDFMDAIKEQLMVLKPNIPLFMFKKIALIAYYLSYKKWTDPSNQMYWKNRAYYHKNHPEQIDAEWNHFLEQFPLFIQSADFYRCNLSDGFTD